MRWLDTKRQEYICRFFGDLAKAIFAVGLASQLFRGSSVVWRIIVGISFLTLTTYSILGYPREKEGKDPWN